MAEPPQNIGLSRLAQQYREIRDEIDEAVARVMHRTVFTPDAEVQALEEEFANYIGVRHAIAVGSGSQAILFALMALGVGAGDEVVSVPNVDVSASAPITHSGAHIVWVDIHPRTYNLDGARLQAKLTNRTRAIVAVHLYGNPAEMNQIMAIAQQHQLAVVEDAALAPGATYRGRRVGSIGHIACFSFAPHKVLGAYGQAGMVVTSDPVLAERVRVMSCHGFEPAYLAAVHRGESGARFIYRMEGFNGFMDELQAAILRVKLRHLDDWLRRRRQNAQVYRSVLAELEPEHILLPEDTPGSEPIYRVYVIRARLRDRLLSYLGAAGVYAGLHYIPPLHLQPAYEYLGIGRGALPQAELVADELLCLPNVPELTTHEVEFVGETVRRFFGR